MTKTAYQLPEDIGQNEVSRNGKVVQAEGTFPSGQKASTKSIPIVLPEENYHLPIIDNYRSPTEVDRDLLGFPRQTRPYSFLEIDDQFELSANDWVFDVTGLNERPLDDSTQSARWTQLSNASAVYSPAPNGEVRYNSNSNSGQLILSNNDGGFQRARIASKRRYRYQPGRIVRASLATRLSVEGSPVSLTRLWGVGDSTDGFFVECKGDGEGDRLNILYRNSAGNGLTFETRVPRSQWNGDKLDGTGKSKQTLDLSKTFMTLIEWGWYGASDVRIFFFVVDKDDQLPTSITQIPRSRWVLAHELVLADTAVRDDLTEPDGAGGTRAFDVPSLRTPSLPVLIEINNSGNLARSHFIERYGASVLVDGGEDESAKIRVVDAGFDSSVQPLIGGSHSGAGQSLATIRSKEKITNADGKEVDNLFMTAPTLMNIGASDLVEIELWLDPEMVAPDELGHINGSLPFKPGDYVSPFNIVPLLITSFDSTGTEFALTGEPPTSERLTVNTQYNSGDLLSLDVSFNDFRIVKSGKRIASFIVDSKGLSVDLDDIFSKQREVLSTEYDSPTEFPPATASLTVEGFDSSTGVISVNRAFPLRLYEGQRVQLGQTNYYVLSIDSINTFKFKAAKVNTTAVTSGISVGDTLVAFYELDLTSNVAANLRPIYRSELVILARPFNANYSALDPAVEHNAEWMRLVNTTSSDAYSIQTAPTVNLYLTNRVS
tara:strand:- start:2358 stop:4508 length:2151 start_codon:yes stop_codon:yes gene_type:complete